MYQLLQNIRFVIDKKRDKSTNNFVTNTSRIGSGKIRLNDNDPTQSPIEFLLSVGEMS